VLLFEVTSSCIAWCFLAGADRVEGEAVSFDAAFPSVEQRLGTLQEVSTVGYMLHHGGTTVNRPVSRIDPDTLLAIRGCSRFLPEESDAVYRLAERGLSTLPAATHLLFCDTAFFVDLPEHVHRYAVPMSLSGPGLRRYGGFGLCHQWVWDSLQELSSAPPSAVVSVCLGEAPNVAAIRDGRAVETTMGFTPVEGLSSARSSGDIDPTVVFELLAAGYEFSDVARMLGEHSGFSAWLGRPCTLAEVAQNRGGDLALAEAREFLGYQIRKAVGACVSALGGVDAIAFSAEDLPAYADFIRAVSTELGFLAFVSAPDAAATSPVLRLARADSRVQAYGLSYDKWQALSERGKQHFLPTI